MHAPFRIVLVSLQILSLAVLVTSRRKAKGFSKASENEVFGKTQVITVKLPNIQMPVKTVKRQPTTNRRRLNTNVEPVQESCQGKTFKAELNLLRQKIKCEPRDTVIDLIPPFGATLTPNAVVVKRCGGMCNGFKRCVPQQQRDVKFYVKTIKNNKMYCSSIIVSEDTKCKCGCLQKAEDCMENQVYSKEKCACTCRNQKDYVQCVESSNVNVLWDESSCSCICQQSRSCTTGTYWSESECRCAKLSH